MQLRNQFGMDQHLRSKQSRVYRVTPLIHTILAGRRLSNLGSHVVDLGFIASATTEPLLLSALAAAPSDIRFRSWDDDVHGSQTFDSR